MASLTDDAAKFAANLQKCSNSAKLGFDQSKGLEMFNSDCKVTVTILFRHNFRLVLPFINRIIREKAYQLVQLYWEFNYINIQYFSTESIGQASE